MSLNTRQHAESPAAPMPRSEVDHSTNAPQVRVVPAAELSSEQWQSWRAIQRADPTFDSAFFHPQYTQLVQQIRGNVEVGVLEQAGRSLGFFPFQRGPRDVAQPVGGRLSEFHGFVVDRDVDWDGGAIVDGCGLAAWYFDHLPRSQQPFAGYCWNNDESPCIDLAGGFEGYVEAMRKSGSSAISQLRRKARKMEREIGPLRFEFHTTDPQVIQQLIDWKAAQQQRTGRVQIFRYDWVTTLLEAAAHVDQDGFAGCQSALYAGDQLVAAHLGLRSDRALHWWFPAYARDHEKYSPGLILLLKLLEEFPERGLARLDLGRGPEHYKQRYKTGDLPIWVGAVDRRPWMNHIRFGWHRVKRRMRASSFRSGFERVMRVTNYLREKQLFR